MPSCALAGSSYCQPPSPFPCCLPLSFGVPFGPIVLSISVERSWSVLLAAAQLLSCSGSSGGCWGHLVECDSRGVISSSSVQRESIYKIFQLVRKCHGNWLCLSPHCFAGGKNTSRCWRVIFSHCCCCCCALCCCCRDDDNVNRVMSWPWCIDAAATCHVPPLKANMCPITPMKFELLCTIILEKRKLRLRTKRKKFQT